MTAAALLTVSEVAERLHVSRRTARRLVESGELPIVRTSPRTVRVTVAALERFIKQRTEVCSKTEKDYRRAEAWN